MIFKGLFILAYGLYAIWLYRYLNKIFKKYEFLRKPEFIKNEKYPAFTRSDYSKWNKTQMYLCGLILFIPRLIMMIMILVMMALVVKIASLIYGIKNHYHPQPKNYRLITSKIICFLGGFVPWSFGIYRKKYTKCKLNESDYEYFEKGPETPETVFVCNHMNLLDMYQIATFYSSLSNISTQMMKNIPLMGYVTMANQVIFVDRNKPNARQRCLQEMRERIKNLKKSPDSKEIANC